MTGTWPLTFDWNGEAFVPIKRHAKEADKRFVVHELYALEAIQQRSWKSHKHYFASVYEGWLNLPEAESAKFATSEHLRKHALIRGGYFDKRSIACSSKAEALRLAAFIKPFDEYAVVTVSGALVEHYTAQSQAQNVMGKERFEGSKRAVLDYIANLLDVPASELERQTSDQ